MGSGPTLTGLLDGTNATRTGRDRATGMGKDRATGKRRAILKYFLNPGKAGFLVLVIPLTNEQSNKRTSFFWV